MKLSEIIKVPQQPSHGFANMSKFDNAVQFRQAKVEKYPLLAFIENDNYYFCLEDLDTKQKFAYLVAFNVDGFQKPTLIIKRTWVHQSHRNKGFMTALYNTLHQQGFSIISDIELSPESLKIWSKVNPDVQIINSRTQEKRKAISSDFLNPLNNAEEHFMLEGSRDDAWGPMRNNLTEMEENHKFLATNYP